MFTHATCASIRTQRKLGGPEDHDTGTLRNAVYHETTRMSILASLTTHVKRVDTRERYSREKSRPSLR